MSGLLLSFMLVTSVPGSRKWPVDLKSATAMSTAILTLVALNIVSALGDACKSCRTIFCCHAFFLIGRAMALTTELHRSEERRVAL